MEIQPHEIRQKRFGISFFAGFSKSAVRLYLQQLSESWFSMMADNQALKRKLEEAQAEIKELRSLEHTLLKTLHETQEANKRLKEQSQEEARLRIANGQVKANALLKCAEQRSRDILHDAAGKYQEQLNQMRKEMKILEHNYQVIDGETDRLLSEMGALIGSTMDQLGKLTMMKKVALVQDKINKTNELIEQNSQQLQEKNHHPQHRNGKTLALSPSNGKAVNGNGHHLNGHNGYVLNGKNGHNHNGHGHNGHNGHNSHSHHGQQHSSQAVSTGEQSENIEFCFFDQFN